MKLGVPNQAAAGEPRVATVPEVVRRLTKRGVEVLVESGAGAGAHVPDEEFEQAGATIAAADRVWAADVVAVELRRRRCACGLTTRRPRRRSCPRIRTTLLA